MKFKAKLADESVNVSKTSPLKEFLSLIIGLSILLAILLILASSFVNIIAPLVPLKTEKRIFSALRPEAASENFFGLGEVKPSPELKTLVDRLAGHWADNPYDFWVGILNSDKINALALPGGTILVTKGLLNEVDSENELAFIVAHEIGHFHNRDALKGLGRGLVTALVLSIFGQGSRVLNNSVATLSTSSYSRKAESMADKFGLELVQAEYGTVSGATDLFKKLLDDEDSAILNRYTRSHPLSRIRVKELTDYAKKRGWTLNKILLPKLIIDYNRY